MRDTLTIQNSEDFNQRYRHTYGWLINDSKEKTLVYIDSVDDRKAMFTTSKGASGYVYAGSDMQFEFIPVNKGWFYNNEGTLWFLSRAPARQWQRGISRGNTNMMFLNRQSNSLIPLGVSLQLLAPIFENTKWKYQYREHDACAMSKHFCVDYEDNIYFYNAIIGKRKNNVLFLDDDLCAQELSDLIRRMSYQTSVKIK